MTNDKPVAGEEPPVTARKPLWRRLLPLGVLLVAVGLAFGLDLHHYLRRQWTQPLGAAIRQRGA